MVVTIIVDCCLAVVADFDDDDDDLMIVILVIVDLLSFLVTYLWMGQDGGRGRKTKKCSKTCSCLILSDQAIFSTAFSFLLIPPKVFTTSKYYFLGPCETSLFCPFHEVLTLILLHSFRSWLS